MGRRGRKRDLHTPGATGAREDLELRWRERLRPRPDLARMVTARDADREPYHRWMHLAQGFSPALVRTFIARCGPAAARGTSGPVLDPFSGAGTTAIECARLGVPATGIEAVPVFAFLANSRFIADFPELPALPEEQTAEQLAGLLEHPLHRAALLLAEARRHTSAGRPRADAAPLTFTLAQVAALIREDLHRPLAGVGEVLWGDARTLDRLPDDSMTAILTSPPYLSRHDYAGIARPYERIYRLWYGNESAEPPASRQLPAAARPEQSSSRPDSAAGQQRSRNGPGQCQDHPPLPPAALEAAAELHADGQPRLADLVTAYFRDMGAVLRQWDRVLRTGGVSWVVIGGARLKDVYVPTDLVLADCAAANGWQVEDVAVARQLTASARKFGRVGHLAPRESVLMLRKR